MCLSDKSLYWCSLKASFLLNARPLTLADAFIRNSCSGGYLFPPDAATRNVVNALVKRRKYWVLSDNGAYDQVGQIATVVSKAKGKSALQLMDYAREKTASIDPSSQWEQQLSVVPDAVVGPEDITVAVWLNAGIPEHILRTRRREIAARNKRIAETGVTVSSQHPELSVYAVASAHDYDSASDAGRIFAKAGVRSVAMGFGAFMADNQWTKAVKVGGRLRRLQRALPLRYLRTALVARGFFDGWSEEKAGGPQQFHFLGLGAPIMLPLVTLAARNVTNVTFDATSPIRDAVGGSLYVNRPASLTIRTWKVVERMLAEEKNTWNCPCKFCRSFIREHPFDLSSPRLPRSPRALSSNDLHPGRPLASALPLFRIGTDDLSKRAEAARIGHNHWVLGSLTMGISKHLPDIQSYVEDHVNRYHNNAGALHFAEAVDLAFDITRPDGGFWKR